MEHSKLPWKINSNGDGYQVQSLDEYETWVARIIQGIPSKEQKANANFIVTACNEHDTLKAFVGEIKDYFVDNCEDCKTESLALYGEHSKEGCKSCLSGRLLATAKELT